MKKTIEPQDITAVVDTREQTPWPLSPLKIVTGTLPTGDYTVLGLENEIAIERKSLEDLLGCVGRERERFDKEVKRLIAYPTRCLIVEASWKDLEEGNWRSLVKPAAALGSVLGWVAAGLPVIMAGDRANASNYAARLMFIAARRRWHQLCSFRNAM